ncbi:MAG TPA: AmmeMemoRadiSam system protein A [Candidatus Hydrogenedentes bacterium]|nr:AmmeMemoRadiSam system protein A [Candidatus Hydrogenedentota bacterium]
MNGAPPLTDGEKRVLLQIARDAIAASLQGRTLPLGGYPSTEALASRRCAFVTLHDAACGLRGCIGTLEARASLSETVRDHAVHAACHDPRFPAVTPDELDTLSVEISALAPGEIPGTPFIPVAGLEEIVVGRDGLYLTHPPSGRGGVLLPQVPVEQGWDLAAFLLGLCRKSGLPPRAWEDPACRLFRFSAEVFGEHDFPGIR